MAEVKEQLLKCKVDLMFKENLSAKMKEIKMSITKKYDAQRRKQKNKLQLEEEEKVRTDEEVDKLVHGIGNAAITHSDRMAPPQVSNLKMQQTLNTVEKAGEQVTELEQLCDFTEVEIGEFDETQAAKQLQQQRQPKPVKIDRSVLLSPGNKTQAIKNVIDRLSSMSQQLNEMNEMIE